MRHVEGTGPNTGGCKNPIVLEMVPLSHAPFLVEVSGSLNWHSTGGRTFYVYRTVILSYHSIKLVFPSYCTYAVYLSSMTVNPPSYRGARMSRLFISMGSVLEF